MNNNTAQYHCEIGDFSTDVGVVETAFAVLSCVWVGCLGINSSILNDVGVGATQNIKISFEFSICNVETALVHFVEPFVVSPCSC